MTTMRQGGLKTYALGDGVAVTINDGANEALTIVLTPEQTASVARDLTAIAHNVRQQNEKNHRA